MGSLVSARAAWGSTPAHSRCVATTHQVIASAERCCLRGKGRRALSCSICVIDTTSLTCDLTLMACFACRCLQVQLQHNKRKSEALRELLATTKAAAEAAAAQCDSSSPGGAGHNGSSSSRQAHDSCSRATAALQDLLDELLGSSNE